MSVSNDAKTPCHIIIGFLIKTLQCHFRHLFLSMYNLFFTKVYINKQFCTEKRHSPFVSRKQHIFVVAVKKQSLKNNAMLSFLPLYLRQFCVFNNNCFERGKYFSANSLNTDYFTSLSRSNILLPICKQFDKSLVCFFESQLQVLFCRYFP